MNRIASEFELGLKRPQITHICKRVWWCGEWESNTTLLKPPSVIPQSWCLNQHILWTGNWPSIVALSLYVMKVHKCSYVAIISSTIKQNFNVCLHLCNCTKLISTVLFLYINKLNCCFSFVT